MVGRNSAQQGDNGWSDWGGYMAAKKRKLEEQFDKDRTTNAKQNERKSNLFQGISIFVDGHTDPPADELKKLMLEHGGVYHTYYSKEKVTYFISNNLPYAKIRKLKPNDKVVRSQWITDCIKENKVLSTHDYEMYKDVTKPRGQTELNFKRVEQTKPITSDFNVPDSDEDADHSMERTPNASENDEADGEGDGDDDDPSVALDAKHPKFLEAFLKRSRLHYLSSTAVAKKVYVQDLRQKPEHRRLMEQRREELKEKIQRTERDYLFQFNADKKEHIYMHIDMDCFFVSVATRHQPELRDQPIVITHSKGKRSATTSEQQFYSRSELASCNYAARQFGVRNGMYLGKAQELCRAHHAKLLCLPYDYEGFHEVSSLFYDTILGYTLDVEAVSCDEMYVDLTELMTFLKPLHPLTFVTLLRDEIHSKTNCPCSAGLASNMLLARLATRQAKPNGQYYVERGYEQEFIAKQKLADLPGVGSSLLEKLQQLSPQTALITCKQVQTLFSLDQLKTSLGKKHGQTIYEMVRGIDTRTLTKEYAPKSISVDVNYGIRFQTFDELTLFIKQIAAELHKRLKQAKQKGKQLTVKIRVRSADAPIEPEKFMGCGRTDDSSRLVNLSGYTDDQATIEAETIKLLKQLNFIVADLRGIGITMTQFQSSSKNNRAKDPAIGCRTLFDCQQFRAPKPVTSSDTNADDADGEQADEDIQPIDEPSESSVTRKRPIPQGSTSVIPKKLPRRDCYTPGQIDPAVMEELPSSIREEVEEYLKNPPAKPKTTTACPTEDETSNVVEKSFTQVMDNIDESVLNELPPEMRREIAMAQKLRQIESKYPPIGGKRPQPAAPTTTVNKDKSNAFNVLMNSPQKGSTTKKTTNPIKKWRTETVTSEETSLPRSHSEIHLTTVADNPHLPSIAGCSSLNDVKLMLREWIESSDQPASIDLDLFQSYLMQLLTSYNAEMVQQLLTYGSVQIETLAKTTWSPCFQRMIEAVQLRFQQMYGGAKMALV